MKKLGIVILLFMCYSILLAETVEIKSVNYTGFQYGVTTIFYVNIFVDDFTTETDCRLWIDVEESSSWNTPYFSNGITNYHEFTVSPSDNGTIIVENILIVPNTTRTIEKLAIRASIGYQPILPEEQIYDLKVVIDVPFDTNYLTENEQQEMAEKFLPVIRLDDGSQIEEQYPDTFVGPEKFIPKQIEILADSCEIWNRRGINDSINAFASKADIANYCQESNYLEFIAGDEPQPIVNWNTANQSNYNTQLYASFCEEDDYIVLSYWFFYLFNNNIGWNDFGATTDQHLGEWEGMNIVFSTLDIQENGINASPLGAATSSHTIGDCGRRRNWLSVERIDSHPIVYVANGSHPTFFHSGHSDNQGGGDRDYHFGDGMWIVPQGDYGIPDNTIDALCINSSYYNCSQIINYGEGGTNSTYVDVIPRLSSINISQLQNYWHIYGGAWGQSKTGTSRDRMEFTAPSSPPFVASIWAGSLPYEHNDGYKWFKPFTWYLDQSFDNILIGVDFTVSADTVIIGETVEFTGSSIGYATPRHWDLDNDGIIDSYAQTPTWTYSNTGVYTVCLTINEDEENSVTVMKTDLITVISAPPPIPIISVTPSELNETLEENQTSQQTINISNSGNALLTCTIYPDADWLSASSVYSSVLAGENEDIEVTFDASSLSVGSYDSYIEIASNDEEIPTVIIPVALEVAGGGTIPNSPTNVIIEIISGQVEVSWDTSNAESYKVYSSNNPNTPQETLVTDQGTFETEGNRTTWTAQIPTENKKYYCVTAVGVAGGGDTCVDYDGNIYQTVIIGNQEWMAENLKVTHYRNGDVIPNLANNSIWTSTNDGAYRVYNNTPTNADTYGNLYNWYAVNDSRNVSPEGWHIPTDEEIKELEMAIGMNESDANDSGYRGTNEGSKLAGRADLWSNGALENNAEFGTVGFSFLPGGYCDYLYGVYHNLNINGYFWSSSGSGNVAWARKLHRNDTRVSRMNYYKRSGLPVRCVRD